MPRTLTIAILFAAAVIAGMASAVRPASAGGAPWCAVVDIGWGTQSSDCSFWTFEECVPHVLAGNRGFCNENPAYTGPAVRQRGGHSRRGWRH
jgi:Protein of unknown function (DUF3551).